MDKQTAGLWDKRYLDLLTLWGPWLPPFCPWRCALRGRGRLWRWYANTGGRHEAWGYFCPRCNRCWFHIWWAVGYPEGELLAMLPGEAAELLDYTRGRRLPHAPPELRWAVHRR